MDLCHDPSRHAASRLPSPRVSEGNKLPCLRSPVSGESCSSAGGSTWANPESGTVPIPHTRARQLKAGLDSTIRIPNSYNEQRSVEIDPEYRETKRLREEQSLSWAKIASILNGKRTKDGRQPILTENAVYSRFVLCNSLIAAEASKAEKIGVQKAGKNVQQGEQGRPEREFPSKFTPTQDEMLVQVVRDTQRGFWKYVAQDLAVKCGVEFTPEQCAQRFQDI